VGGAAPCLPVIGKQCADDPELVEELLGLFAAGLNAAAAALNHAIDATLQPLEHTGKALKT
jgi:hypothetical protein